MILIKIAFVVGRLTWYQRKKQIFTEGIYKKLILKKSKDPSLFIIHLIHFIT